MTTLDAPMAGDGCRAELFAEQWRESLKSACAEDHEIWQIYANNFGPDGFDDSIELYRSTSRNRTFVLFDGEDLAGMSSFLGIDENRGVLEIGGTQGAAVRSLATDAGFTSVDVDNDLAGRPRVLVARRSQLPSE